MNLLGGEVVGQGQGLGWTVAGSNVFAGLKTGVHIRQVRPKWYTTALSDVGV